MFSKQFFISDTHFGHNNILTFRKNDGSLLRDFKSIEEMDDTIITNWNKVVKDTDTVYHLGDVAINRKALKVLYNLKGRKVLIKGNHDIFKLDDYTEYFDDIRAYKVFTKENFICSHIPLHTESLYRWKLNVHGHLHGNKVMLSKYKEDDRYLSVCCEQINYTPVDLDYIMERLK